MGRHGDACDRLCVSWQRPEWSGCLEWQQSFLMSLWWSVECWVNTVDTNLPDINVVKCASFRAGKTVEGSEVIPKHPECHIIVTGNKENTVLFKLNTKNINKQVAETAVQKCTQSSVSETRVDWPLARHKVQRWMFCAAKAEEVILFEDGDFLSYIWINNFNPPLNFSSHSPRRANIWCSAIEHSHLRK